MKSGQRPLTAVRGLVGDEQGRILVLKRDHTSSGAGLWCLPGGKIEYGQTAEAAIRLEIFEETSLRVNEVTFLFYLDGLPTPENPLHYITLFFLCRTTGEVKLNDESSAYAWIAPEEIDSYPFAFLNDRAVKMYWELKSRHGR